MYYHRFFRGANEIIAVLFLRQISSWLETEGIPFLDSHSDIGDSIGHVASLQAEFLSFEANAKVLCGFVYFIKPLQLCSKAPSLTLSTNMESVRR